MWGPLPIGLVGVGLIGSGIFVTDPLNGYPPGTPLIPTERTAQGILHDLFGIPVFLGLPITCFVFARLFARWGERSWAVYSRLSGIGMFTVFFVARLGFRLLPTYPDLAANFGLLQRITVTIGFTWLTLLWAVVWILKVSIQAGLYLADQEHLLGAARLILGTPPYLVLLAVTIWVVRRVSPDASEPA